MDLATFNKGAAVAAAYLSRPLNLKEIRLPEGDVGSINIGWPNNGAQIKLNQNEWLNEGYDGVRLIGAGVDKTHIRCTSWDGTTFNVTRHAGVVQLEGVTLYAGYSRGTNIGQQNLPKEFDENGKPKYGTQKVEPKFAFRFLESKGIVLPPNELPNGQGRTKWLIFGYNYDEYLRDVELDATFASEHARYKHGSAKRGSLWDRVRVRGSGAEGYKERSDCTETGWAGRNVWVIVKKTSFANWYQTWSDRGGAGMVLQGAAANVLVEDCVFRGGPESLRSKCIMISSEADSYDKVTGAVGGTGPGNGWILVRSTGLSGYSPGFWHNTLMSVYKNSGSQLAAQGVLVQGIGGYGFNMILSFKDIPIGQTLVTGCNTPALKALSESAGFDTRYQAVIPTATRLVPLSEGYAR